ncbi:hypothetical protein DACRYDRAFT_112160 [Dacryopinax primogenitus]|uniref:Uncharacterized protein n=1 Tax=Dacryopinax primogenitus (strain DJM 731) TaxID=1858805 RepID=M5FNC6_DACPD|nr:uncharacterized protein DACRYDRAFT_112160 [Dacryopinax primogenitus]EJT97210.1 hypothetical protein DACRYDRAFT_112160 [Dacryopinax primogenitus]
MRIPSVLLAILSLSVIAHPIPAPSGTQSFDGEYALQRSTIDEMYVHKALAMRDGFFKNVELADESPHETTARLKAQATAAKEDWKSKEQDRDEAKVRYKEHQHASKSKAKHAQNVYKQKKQIAEHAEKKKDDASRQKLVWNLHTAKKAHGKATSNEATAKKHLATLTRAHQEETDPLQKSEFSNEIETQAKVVSDATAAKKKTKAQVDRLIGCGRIQQRSL